MVEEEDAVGAEEDVVEEEDAVGAEEDVIQSEEDVVEEEDAVGAEEDAVQTEEYVVEGDCEGGGVTVVVRKSLCWGLVHLTNSDHTTHVP